MKDTILMASGEISKEIPQKDWEEGLTAMVGHMVDGLAFMTQEHHRVRNFAVRELPRVGSPLATKFIAESLNLKVTQTKIILDELEKHMTFLFRNEQGAVAWAYPVTVDPTPHRVHFSTGESLYAAWAIDAIATPFVQGRLRGEPLIVTVESSCANCGASLTFEMDSDFRYQFITGSPEPLLFHPFVDFGTLTDPSIIDAFWHKSQFFCSEEHAKSHRAVQRNPDGNFYTLEQGAFFDRIVQSALFAFRWPVRIEPINQSRTRMLPVNHWGHSFFKKSRMLMFLITELARKYGLSRSTLLYYDHIGLLTPSGRSEAGYRLYSLEDGDTLATICSFRKAGLTIEDIRRILSTEEDANRVVLQRRMRELGEEIRTLQTQQHLLGKMMQIQSQGELPVTVDKQAWIEMLRAAGMDEAAMRKWHTEFEHRAPEAHHQFLFALGISEDETLFIRKQSMEEPKGWRQTIGTALIKHEQTNPAYWFAPDGEILTYEWYSLFCKTLIFNDFVDVLCKRCFLIVLSGTCS